jgi:DNA-binding NtrC family response regulator
MGLEYKERLRMHMQRYETELIVEALRRFNGNQTEAARALQMPVRTLAHKIQTYGIKKTFEPK